MLPLTKSPAADPDTAFTTLLNRIYTSQYCVGHRIPGPFGNRLVTYADYVASGQALTFIEAYINRVVLPTYANTHTDASFTGRQTTRFRDEARALIKQSVNATDDDVLLFCGSGATGAIDTLFRQLIRTYARPEHTGQPGPLVLLGPFEHHANLLPWRESGYLVVTVPLTRAGTVDLDFLETQLRTHVGTRPIIGSFSAASNVTGIRAPVDDITGLLHRYGALSLWDYAAAAPYLPIDMNPGGEANKDAVFISAHKLVGGPGTPGILVAKKHLFTQPVPSVPGGGTVHFVSRTGQQYLADLERREEAGTPAIVGAIRAGLVFKLKDTVGVAGIERRETAYIRRAIRRFGTCPAIRLLGSTTAPRLGIVAFNIEWRGRVLHHNFVVALLNDLFGIQARGGCSCAGPYGLDLLAIGEELTPAYEQEMNAGNAGQKPGWVRLNINYFIPDDEFQFLLDSVCWVARHGWKLLKHYEFDDHTALWHHRRRATVPLGSLHTFLRPDNAPPPRPTEAQRVAERVTYLTGADACARRALGEWATTPGQTYRHTQVSNPHRWYALADDWAGAASVE